MVKRKGKKLSVDTEKIREDYGTIKRFCRLHGINPNTYNVVMSGFFPSKRIVNLLEKEGYLKGVEK